MARKWKSIKSQRARRLQVTGSLLGLSYHSFTHSLPPPRGKRCYQFLAHLSEITLNPPPSASPCCPDLICFGALFQELRKHPYVSLNCYIMFPSVEYLLVPYWWTFRFVSGLLLCKQCCKGSPCTNTILYVRVRCGVDLYSSVTPESKSTCACPYNTCC